MERGNEGYSQNESGFPFLNLNLLSPFLVPFVPSW